jgi:alpha-beta hydrolase superfamily lysophospholipase
MTTDNTLVQALANEYRRIADALAKIGYTVIKLDLESVGNAAKEGDTPDLRIWARPTENL